MNAAVNAATRMAELSPTDLENMIEAYRTIGTFTRNPIEREVAFSRMRQLIAQRSPDRVREMEREQGLS